MSHVVSQAVNQSASDWLPKEAITGDAVHAALSEVLEGWAVRWFAAPEAIHWDIGTTQARRLHAVAQSFELRGAYVTLELSGLAKRHLLERLLDVDLAAAPPQEGDHRVMDAFAAQVSEDLIAKLEAALSGEGGGALQVRMTAKIANRDLLSLCFPACRVIPLLKGRLARTQTAPPRVLRARMSALGPVSVAVEGHLGNADLAMREVEEMAVGDVIVLDRNLNQCVELRVAKAGKQIGRGRLQVHDNQLSIQF